MIRINVEQKRAAETQVRLHLIKCTAEAILEDRRVREERMSAPQIIPAGLGTTMPLKQKGDTSGSDLIAKLDKAVIAAETTGSKRDQARVELWKERLRNLGAADTTAVRMPRSARGEVRRVPSVVYAVRVPPLTVTYPGGELRITGQRVQLDLREGARTQEQEEALRTVLWEEAAPVIGGRGEKQRRATRIPENIWNAWNVLADSLGIAPIEEYEQLNCAAS